MIDAQFNANLAALLVNHIASRDMRNINSALGQSHDDKRPHAWCEYGYPAQIDNHKLDSMFERNSIAHGVVSHLRAKCWQSLPDIIEGEPSDETRDVTAWERSIRGISESKIFPAVRDAQEYYHTFGWSGVILQLKDSRAWDQPVTRGKKELLRAIPFKPTQLKAGEIDMSERSENYGQPKNWIYIDSCDGVAISERVIHPDRIVFFGDWGRPKSLLTPCYNNLINIEKIEGGSGESYLKNASRQFAISFDKDIDMRQMASDMGIQPSELHTVFDETAKEMNRGNDSILALKGATATPLVAAVPQPKEHYEMNLSSIAAATTIPMKIISGMQTGERASTEDNRQFSGLAMSVRINDLTPFIRGIYDKLMRHGVIETMEYSVIWDDLMSATEAERIALAKEMATTNSLAASTSGPVFTPEEIRTTAGFTNDDFEPLPEPNEEQE